MQVRVGRLSVAVLSRVIIIFAESNARTGREMRFSCASVCRGMMLHMPRRRRVVALHSIESLGCSLPNRERTKIRKSRAFSACSERRVFNSVVTYIQCRRVYLSARPRGALHALHARFRARFFRFNIKLEISRKRIAKRVGPVNGGTNRENARLKYLS